MNRILTTERFKRQVCIKLTNIVAVHVDVAESGIGQRHAMHQLNIAKRQYCLIAMQ